MRYGELLKLKQDIDLLIKGIDPQTNLYVGDDSILSSNYNQRVLCAVSSIIDRMLKLGMNPYNTDRRKKFNFYLSPREREQIQFSQTPLSISEFTHLINSVVDCEKMKRLKATTITSWLLNNKYLEEVSVGNGDTVKVSTKLGESIGISYLKKKNEEGKTYNVNLYDANAQKFLLNHLDQIIDVEALSIDV